MNRSSLLTIAAFSCCFVFLSCSLAGNIPTVKDEPAQRLVHAEAARIIRVSEDRDALSSYRIFLSDFPRRDILGLSTGKRRIYISYRLSRLALHSVWHRWLLRQTLAHEVAHETTDHAKREGAVSFNESSPRRGVIHADIGLPSYITFRNYSYERELEADALGMDYWRRLNWDCAIWVRILESFRERDYSGDLLHPTEQRLMQARRVCTSKSPLVGAAPSPPSIVQR